MDIKETLAAIDALIDRLKEPIPSREEKKEWNTLQKKLAALVTEAEQLRLPWVMVVEYGTRLQHHVGVLLGQVADGGHPRDQHWRWAYGDMQAMRSSHAFGPAARQVGRKPERFGALRRA